MTTTAPGKQFDAEDVRDAVLDIFGRATEPLPTWKITETLKKALSPAVEAHDVRLALVGLRAEGEIAESPIGNIWAPVGDDLPSPDRPPLSEQPEREQPERASWRYRERPDGQGQDDLWESFERNLRGPCVRLPVPLSLVVAAHEWSLATPLSINSKDDFQVLPDLRVKPYIHQVKAAIAFFRRFMHQRGGLIADDVGLGKTVTAGLILAELILRGRVRSFLIVAPKLIQEQWKDELSGKFNLRAEIFAGAELKHLPQGVSAITTYHSAARHMDRVEAAKFDMVILDEVHKLKSLHSEHPAMMARRFHEAQGRQSFRFVIALSATPLQNTLWDMYSIAGIVVSPRPNPYGDEQHFITRYLEAGRGKKGRPSGRKLKDKSREDFRRRTSEFMHRTSRHDSQLIFPTREVKLDKVEPSDEERGLLQDALTALLGSNASAFERISVAQTILSSPKAALAAIDNAQKPSPLAPLRSRFAAVRRTAKLNRVIALVQAYAQRDPSWRLLIFTIRRATAEYIHDALEQEGFRDAVAVVLGGQGARNTTAITDFMQDPPRRHVLVSTDTGAEGVNLQKCNVVVNFDLPWNPMLLEQRIGRVQRLGQLAAKVVVYNLATIGSVEEAVVARLYEKLQLYDAAIGMAEEILGQLDQNDEGFEAAVLTMVEAAIQRGNLEAMLEEQRKNAEQAKKDLEQMQRYNDNVVGTIDAEQGARMPDIKPSVPSMPAPKFWRSAMETQGWTINSRDQDKTIEASAPGRKLRRFTFDAQHPGRHGDPVLGTYAVELVSPNERAFDEVVNNWTRVDVDATAHKGVPPAEDVRVAFHRLVSARVANVSRVRLTDRKVVVRALPIARVNSSVYHDQFEKVLHGSAPIETEVSVEADSDIGDALSSPTICDRVRRDFASLVLADTDFRAFRGFYESRRREEEQRLDRARQENPGPQQAYTKQLEDIERRLTVLDETVLIGWEGDLVEQAEAHIDITLKNGKSATTRLPLWGDRTIEEALARAVGDGRGPTVCDSGHIVATQSARGCRFNGCDAVGCAACSDWSRCGVCGAPACHDHQILCASCGTGLCDVHRVMTSDGRSACPDCIGKCDVSGVLVLKKELVHCDDTGDWVMPTYAVRSEVSGRTIAIKNAVYCAVSGKPAGQGELARCDVTGKLVLPSELGTCAKTGRHALLSEMAKCAVTGGLCLKELLVPCEESNELALPELMELSAVSGKRVLPRLLSTCAVTGKKALEKELAPSEVSGRLALPECLVACEVTGKRALPTELGVCAASGKRALTTLMVKSAASGRIALKEHTTECAVCGRPLIHDELKKCVVTGRLAETSCMTRSEISGELAIQSAMVLCGATKRWLLPNEAEECEATGRRVARDQIVVCAYSGRRIAEDQTQQSAVTGAVGWTKAMRQSDVSDAWAGPKELIRTVGGKSVLPSEAQECPSCGAQALLQPPHEHEAFRCPSCKATVCRVHCSGSEGKCVLCSQALGGIGAAEPPSPCQEQFPKAKRWVSARGVKQTVAVGIPSGWAMFTRPQLFVIGSDAKVVFRRDVDKEELGGNGQ